MKMTDNGVFSVALLSASCNIVLQVLVRIISSLSNAIIFRFISKEALGVVNVRLLLLYSTGHCFSREALRRSCLSTFNKNSIQQKFNLLWIIIPVCLLCSFILRHVWLYVLEAPDPNLVPHYSAGVNIVVLSVFIESLAEPIFVFSQSFHFVKLKVINEGLMLTVRSVSMVLCLSNWPHQAMYCFCFSQVLSSIVYTSSYYGYFTYYLKIQDDAQKLIITSITDTFPKLSKPFIHIEELKLVWSFFKQTVLKQLLTEGERYLMTFFSLLSFADQGLYDVVNNLGSLAARFIFLPVEDSAYLLFTQLLPRSESSQSQENLTLCLTILGNILKMMMLCGITILFFGLSYSQLLLYFYGGVKLSSGLGLTLMRWHCVYVFLIAINGISEGFKFAVMSHTEIDRYNKNLVLLSVGFLIAAYVLVTIFGSVGFILANCINMIVRIIHSFYYIEKYFKISKGWFLSKIMPHSSVILSLIIILCWTLLSEAKYCCVNYVLSILHLIVGSICFFVFLLIIGYKEKALINFIQDQWQTRNKISAKPKLS